MLKPVFKIKIGSETYEPGSQSPVLKVDVNLNMDIPADSVEIILGVDDNTLKIKEGDDAIIELGYEGELKKVFTGSVDNVIPAISTLRVRGLNYASKLLELRVNKVFEKQAAGKIVGELANVAGVKEDTVKPGISFPYYVIDDSKNSYEHIKELAGLCGYDVYMTNENKLVFKRLCGYDVYMTNENKLVFKSYEKKGTHTLEYGVNIIDADYDEDRPMIKSVNVQGESPSSFKGADTSHWLTKRSVDGLSGSGSGVLFTHPALRDKDTAAKVAKAIMDGLQRNLSGTIETVGNADVKLGDTLEVKGMTNSKMNGEFQVRSVEHQMSKSKGFITTIGWRK